MFSNKSSHVLEKLIFGSLIKEEPFGSFIKKPFGSLIKDPFGSLTAEKLFDYEKLTFLTAEKIIFKANAKV